MVALRPQKPEGIGALIRRERLRLNMTQEKLARQIGVSTMVVSRWERGELRTPRFGALSRLAQLFGVPLESFVGARAPVSAGEAMRRERLRGSKALEQVKRLFFRTKAIGGDWARVESLLDELVPWSDEHWGTLEDQVEVQRSRTRAPAARLKVRS